jgi:hypothetical protein
MATIFSCVFRFLRLFGSGHQGRSIVTIWFHETMSSFINDPLAMSSAQKDWKNRALRLIRLTAESVMCQTCNCPFPAVVLIADQKTKGVQALCKVHVRAMTGQDTDLVDSE